MGVGVRVARMSGTGSGWVHMRPPLAGNVLGAVLRAFVGDEGAPGRMVLSCALAGGVATGGLLVGALTLSGRVSPGFQLLAAPVLFLVGTILGYAAGGVMALLARPAEVPLRRAVRCAGLGALCALPVLVLGWLVTAGISVTAATLVEPRLSWTVLATVAWILGFGVCAWAFVEVWRGLRRIAARIVARWSSNAPNGQEATT